MNNLIPINYDNDRQTVSAKALYDFLELDKSQWARWHKKNIEEDSYFTQGLDYIPLDIMSNGNSTKDFQITIEMAKELSMMARTEKGKQARQYFIELEKRWNSPEAVMARALKMADKTILTLESGIKERDEKIKELKPAAEFGNAVGNCNGAILVRDYVKILAKSGIKMGQDQFFSWLHVKGYIYRTKERKPQWAAKAQFTELDMGLFKVKETPISSAENGDIIKFTIKITGKGQKYFFDKLKSA